MDSRTTSSGSMIDVWGWSGRSRIEATSEKWGAGWGRTPPPFPTSQADSADALPLKAPARGKKSKSDPRLVSCYLANRFNRCEPTPVIHAGCSSRRCIRSTFSREPLKVSVIAFLREDVGMVRLRSKANRSRHHVTIREVAKAARASVSTISAALNNSDYVSREMRNRIEGAIKKLRYRPNDLARGLRLQKTQTIAIVVPDLSNNFYIEVVRGAKEYSTSANYTVLIGDSRDSWDEERNYLDLFHRRRVDGVVRVPAIDAAGKKAKSVLGNLPVVYADRYPTVGDSFVGRVGVDNGRAADSATRYLLSLGHRKIAIIVGEASSGTSVDRLNGFLGALRSANIPQDRSMIHIGHNDMESGHRHAMELLTSARRPTALFCTNNMMALGALAAIQEIGINCPEQISLLAFDDFYWATLLRPRMTVVRQPAREVGMVAARMLIDHIEGRSKVSKPVLLATQLIIRDSCACPKKPR